MSLGRSERIHTRRPYNASLHLGSVPQDEQSEKKLMAQKLKESLHSRKNSGPPPKLDEKGNLLREEVEKRRSASSKISTYTMDRSKCTIEYAYCTQRGYYPNDPHKLNQDEFSIDHNFAGIEGDSFFAVYDGHGPVGDHL